MHAMKLMTRFTSVYLRMTPASDTEIASHGVTILARAGPPSRGPRQAVQWWVVIPRPVIIWSGNGMRRSQTSHERS
ncbi:hypothetical protein, partial [Acidithiobacillus ferrianus]|uniref:hypothetical protein n=1 Tax=Acidithiobacillus ferrianus TaxID=2678518 RepID=UPI0034E42120